MGKELFPETVVKVEYAAFYVRISGNAFSLIVCKLLLHNCQIATGSYIL